MNPLQIAENLSASGLDHPAVDDAVIKLTNMAKAEPVAWLTSIGVATNTPPLADSPLSKEWTPLYAHPSRGDVGTPSSRWAAAGEPDPHGTAYDCERAALAMGDMTDDELANAVFMHGDQRPSIEDLMSGKALLPGAYLTAAKERIRWLSRKLQAAALPAVPDGWVSVSERLPEEGVLVLVYVPDAGDGERFDQDHIEDGAWAIHNEHREHYLAVGGTAAAGPDAVCTGPSEDAPYTHWKPLRAPSATPAHDQPEGEG